MIFYDGHVHLGMLDESPQEFADSLKEAGISRAVLISPAPNSLDEKGNVLSWKERLERILQWQEMLPSLLPFLWIDPTESDINTQIDTAVSAGISGFKVICTHYSPSDDAAMEIWTQIANAGKPLLFHTGILIGPGSSEYCRPLYYEKLLSVPGLRFCMAHVSWPWQDECLALFSKWDNCRRQGATNTELYMDTTPGTPKSYRRDMLAKLYGSGLPVADKLIFGSDLRNHYCATIAKKYLAQDWTFLNEFRVSPKEQEKYFSQNLLAFVTGNSDNAISTAG